MLECRIDDFDFDDLYGMLLTEECRLKREDEIAIIPPSAQFSQFSSNQFNRGRGRGRGGRGRGRTSPHFSSPSQGRGYQHSIRSSYAPTDASPIVCHNCNGNGHLARLCPSPKMNNSFRAPTKPSSNLASTSSQTNQPWLMDSGTTHHLTANLDNLSIHSKYTGPEEAILGNGSQLPITHIGISHVLFDNRKFLLHDILRVPSATHNLLSANSFTRSNHVFIEFFPDHFVIKDLATRAILHHGKNDGGLYSFDSVPIRSSIQSYSASLSTWHARLGHANAPTVHRAIDKSLISAPSPFLATPSSSSRLPLHLSACSGSPGAATSVLVQNADVCAIDSLDSSLAIAATSPCHHPMVTRSQTESKFIKFDTSCQLCLNTSSQNTSTSADLCSQAVADFTENYSSATIIVAVSAMIAVGQRRPTMETLNASTPDFRNVGLGLAEGNAAEVEGFRCSVDDIFTKVDKLEQRVNEVEEFRVNEVEEFYLTTRKKQPNTSKGCSIMKDKGKEKHAPSIKKQKQDTSRREAAARYIT
ncbi:hypothetical protein F0562_026022 [Nyssa sinensis]|uniref:CCHC-type domain-containing protein n=1 Tax=Nyssa sinensis TaxID=561372 RepID=A0A5J5BA39_9ASTE|nr:hypothetical protein F0562_026022 [Nyssa sinensis]